MKIAKVLLAAALTILLLVAARKLSTRHPDDLAGEAQGVRLEHRSITEHRPGAEIDVTATLQASDAVVAVLRYRVAANSPYQKVTMARVGGRARAILPADLGRRGDRVTYFLSAEDSSGAILATIPADTSKPLLIKFKGRVTTWLLVAHITAMFGSLFFALLTAMAAVDLWRGVGRLKVVVRNSAMALYLISIGGFPLGLAVAYQTFGVAWSGVPFGWDVTDNKTLILVLCWLVTVLLGLKRLSRAAAASHHSFLLLVFASVLVTLAAYLIPHSM